MEKKQALSIVGLKKQFGKTTVLRDINIDINEGELLGLIGPSGAGKSTILKILVGIQNKDSGRIVFNGKKVKNLKKFRSKIGYCTQENAFYRKLTVRENLIFFGKLYGVDRKVLNSRVDNLINLMKIPKKRVAEKLSGGMKRRLDLAISLVHNPPFIILDEPTTGLDPILRSEIWELIRKISSSGKTIIVASHMLSEIEANCSTVVVMAKGKVQTVEKPNKIKDRYPGVKNLEELFRQVIIHAQ
jgi:ABC-2 type transport system ATP-binding protein